MSPAGIARNPLVRAGLVTAHLTRAGGGVFTSVRQLTKALGAQPDLEVEVLGPAPSGDGLPGWGPIKPRTATRMGPAFFAYAPGLVRQMMGADLDLVHLHGLWMHTSAATLAFTRKTRKPHLISPHGMLDPWALENSGWKKRLAATFFEDANLESAACLHALNPAEEKAMRDYGFAGPICVIPNGIDVPAVADDVPRSMPWWTKTAPEIKTLLYLGRIHPKKGLPNLLKAWSRLDGDIRKGWRMVIAGWDENRHQILLRRLAQALHIESTVIFPGPMFGDEKRAAFHYSEGFILPSISEGLPMVLLEAWAYGKPVLMTPQCNLPEGYEANASIRIEPAAESIGEGLRSFLAMSDAERNRIGANGRELVARRFAWPVIAGEMAGVYRWMAGEMARPAVVTTP
jgi:glycosyltransferase involved in cell wall biosynthesis